MKLSLQLRKWQGPRTAAQAAAALGVNRRTYEDWLQGRRRPRGLALEALRARLAKLNHQPSTLNPQP